MIDTKSKKRERIALSGVTPVDFAVIVPIMAISLLMVLWPNIGVQGSATSGAEAILYRDGQPAKRVALNQDQTVDFLEGKMLLEIKENGIRVKHSDCPRQLCVHQGWAKHAGDTIVCIPHKIMIEIQATGTPAVDAVVY